MENVLEKIVSCKRGEIEAAKSRRPESLLLEQLFQAPPAREFTAALSRSRGIGLIAEIKKASPSAGIIREDFDPVKIAGIYEQHGASCLSVLTDEHFFQGHLDFLVEVRKTVSIPVLRKDFILDRYQVLEARAAGADCILLIAECLEDDQLSDLYHYAEELGMESLIEIYEPGNLERVLPLNPNLLGINNRNLKTFVTDLEHSISMVARIPQETLLVSESGIRNRNDVVRLQEAGVSGILVGETLMRAEDIGEKVEELLGSKQ